MSERTIPLRDLPYKLPFKIVRQPVDGFQWHLYDARGACVCACNTDSAAIRVKIALEDSAARPRLPPLAASAFTSQARSAMAVAPNAPRPASRSDASRPMCSREEGDAHV